jgi:SAM-dependent methyltransferase
VLEFGCASGRLIRHLRCIDGIRLAGTDLDDEPIQWCRANLPGVEFHVNGFRPPLEFAEDNAFDLVFAASVFTHIPDEVRYGWIQEMQRILSPGGFLICTLHGPYHEAAMLSADDRARLRRQGRLTLEATDPRTSLSSRITGQCDVFATRSEVLREYGSVLRVRDYVPDFQDILIAQKV